VSNDRERNKEGQFVETITSQRVLKILRESDDPVLTAKEVGERLECTSEAARTRLHELEERGDVESKTVGARAVVWYPA
jgi:predicted ArsR family transcriptional regulator